MVIVIIIVIVFIYISYNVVKKLKKLIKANYPVKAMEEFLTKEIKAKYLAH